METVKLKKWVVRIMAFGWATTSVVAYAGYDFEPISMRAVVRWFGVGPGPGYHSAPCMPLEARYHRLATNYYAPLPVEPDYYPINFGQATPWQPPSGTTSSEPARIQPPAAPSDAPRDDDASPASPSDRSPTRPPRPGGGALPAPTPRQPAAAGRSPSTLDGQLLDELLKSPQEETDPMFDELQPPGPSGPPDDASSAPVGPTAGTSVSREWW